MDDIHKLFEYEVEGFNQDDLSEELGDRDDLIAQICRHRVRDAAARKTSQLAERMRSLDISGDATFGVRAGVGYASPRDATFGGGVPSDYTLAAGANRLGAPAYYASPGDATFGGRVRAGGAYTLAADDTIGGGDAGGPGFPTSNSFRVAAGQYSELLAGDRMQNLARDFANQDRGSSPRDGSRSGSGPRSAPLPPGRSSRQSSRHSSVGDAFYPMAYGNRLANLSEFGLGNGGDGYEMPFGGNNGYSEIPNDGGAVNGELAAANGGPTYNGFGFGVGGGDANGGTYAHKGNEVTYDGVGSVFGVGGLYAEAAEGDGGGSLYDGFGAASEYDGTDTDDDD